MHQYLQKVDSDPKVPWAVTSHEIRYLIWAYIKCILQLNINIGVGVGVPGVCDCEQGSAGGA